MTWDYLSWRASCMQADACRSKHIHFRPLALEDTDEIIAWRNSAFVRQHFIYQQPFTRDGHLRWFAEQLLSGRAVQFLVCANDDGRHLGSVYLRDIDRTHARPSSASSSARRRAAMASARKPCVSSSATRSRNCICTAFTCAFSPTTRVPSPHIRKRALL